MCQELISARKTLDLVVAALTLHAPAKLVSRGNKVHQLSEYGFAGIHQ
jgi:hypothetical protein